MGPTPPHRRRARAAARALAGTGLLWALAGTAAAAPGAFTDRAAFQSAVPGGVATLDFESLPDGAPLSGTTHTPTGSAAGVVLPGPIADVLDPGGAPLALRVVVDPLDNPASSGTRSLGVEDAGNFHALAAGSTLMFGFTSPVEGFGLTLITPEEPGGALFDGDVRLLVSGEPTASLSLADGQLLGTFGGRSYRAYFLGVVGASPFAAATLDFGAAAPESGFFFNLDDLVVPMPEPRGDASFVAASLLIGALAWRSRRKGSSR